MKLYSLLLILLSVSLFSDINLSIYMAADNSMIYAYEQNINDIVEGSKYRDIKIIIKADTPDNTYIFYIQNGNIDTLSIGANVNSGDKQEIADFFIWSFNNFKCDINIVNLWNHGNGWYDYKGIKSILYDNNPYDFISIINDELEDILSRIYNSIARKIDIIIFDACNMQSIEVLYEIKDYCKYALGSALIIPYYGLPYKNIVSTIDTIYNPEAIGEYICRAYYENYKDDYDSLQISFINLGKLKFDYSYLDLSKRLNEEDIAIEQGVEGIYFTNLSFGFFYKMFFPDNPNTLLYYYKDYIKLNFDREFDIMKYEFNSYNIVDTIPPLSPCSLKVIDRGYSNYYFETNNVYDLTQVSYYDFSLIPKYIVYSNDFEDTNEVFSGEYIFIDDAYNSQYALKTDSLIMKIKSPYQKNIVCFKIKGIYKEDNPFYIIADNDTIDIETFPYDKFKTIIKEINSDEFIIYYNNNSNGYIILDDLNVYSKNGILTYSSNTNDIILHKLKKGEYIVIVKAYDIYNNVSTIDTLFNYKINKILFSYVYPNPANNYININTDFDKMVNVLLLTNDGKMIDRFDIMPINGIINIDLRHYSLNSGLYFYIVQSDNIKQTGKFFIK